MSFHLPRLPFSHGALAPFISKETMDFHYGKHHKGYVEKTNEFLADSGNRGRSLEDLVLTTHGSFFNAAAQAWNHAFYWHCLSPDVSKPSSSLARSISVTFGDQETFFEKFVDAANENFGSGWTWLVRDEDGEIDILNTSNADTPIKNGLVPLYVADVWEHAYYIDHRNDRKKHLETLKQVLNWNFVSERFEAPEIFSATAEMRLKRVA